MKHKLLEAVEQEFKLKREKELPKFNVGDTVRIDYKITEGTKERIQVYEGLVIRVKNAGLGSNFVVRKVVANIGVERIFPFNSPYVVDLKVVRRGGVRRAKLYYIRKLRGKAARIKEVL